MRAVATCRLNSVIMSNRCSILSMQAGILQEQIMLFVKFIISTFTLINEAIKTNQKISNAGKYACGTRLAVRASRDMDYRPRIGCMV